MQQILTDWLWKIEIKDPKYIKGYSKLTSVEKVMALDKYIKDEIESRKLIWACNKFFNLSMLSRAIILPDLPKLILSHISFFNFSANSSA